MKAFVSTSLVAILLICSSNARGQTTRPASRPGGSVAVVDVSYIFKNHDRFKKSMESMKGQVKAFEEQLKGKAEQLKAMGEGLSDFKAGSSERRQREQEIARRQAQLQADTSLKQKEFLEAEARLYHSIYNEITQEVAKFCARERISLVLRYNSEKIDPNDRASVLQGVNRAVVYQRNSNITLAILDRLNGASSTTRVSDAPRRKPSGAR